MESGCDDVAFSRTCEPVDSIYLHLFETGCSRYLFTRFGIERSATYIFLSLNMLTLRISRLLFSMAIHNQIYSESTLIIVSSTINSKILVFL